MFTFVQKHEFDVKKKSRGIFETQQYAAAATKSKKKLF